MKLRPETPEPKHIAELNATQRAIADQSIRDALLAIIVAQGKVVTFPIDVLNATSESHRLVIEVDRATGTVTMTAEKAQTIING